MTIKQIVPGYSQSKLNAVNVYYHFDHWKLLRLRNFRFSQVVHTYQMVTAFVSYLNYVSILKNGLPYQGYSCEDNREHDRNSVECSAKNIRHRLL